MSQDPNEPPATPSRQFKGVWLCVEILDNEELSPVEKILLAEIDSLTHPEKACFATNDFLAKRLHVSEAHMRDTLADMTTDGYIIRLSFNGRVTLRCVHPRLSSNPASSEKLIQKHGVKMAKDGPGSRKKKAEKSPDSSSRKIPTPKRRHRKIPIADSPDFRDQESEKSDTKKLSTDTKTEETTTKATVSAKQPEPEVVVVPFVDLFEEEARNEAATLETIRIEFCLNPKQTAEVKTYATRNGLAYVEQKAALTRAGAKTNSAAFFMDALTNDWQPKKGKDTRKVNILLAGSEPELPPETDPKTEFAAESTLWSNADETQRQTWLQDKTLRLFVPKEDKPPGFGFLSRLRELIRTTPEAVT